MGKLKNMKLLNGMGAARNLAACSLALAIASLTGVALPAQAGPALGIHNTLSSNIEGVGWRGWGWGVGAGYYPPYYYRPAYQPYSYYYPAPVYYYPRYYPATVYAGPVGGAAVAYCMQRFRSYDPRTSTYLGYDGYRHPCP
jgi:hypothetical protein